MDKNINIDINHFVLSIPNTIKTLIKASTLTNQTDLLTQTEQDVKNLTLLETIRTKDYKQSLETVKPLNFFETLCPAWMKQSAKKGIEFFVYIDPNLPISASLNTHILSIVLNELISNAIKFTPKLGSIHLDIRQSFINDKEHLCINISDTGVGIVNAKIPKLFREFHGPSNTGLGLGLATSFFLLRDIGVELKISSEVTKGSRFTFSVPLSNVENQSLSPKKSLHMGILQEHSDMDEYTRQLFSYLLALGCKLINIENVNDPKVESCQALFIVDKAFNRRRKNTLKVKYPSCIIIPVFLATFDKDYDIYKQTSDYKLLLPLLPWAMLDCFSFITSEIALQSYHPLSLDEIQHTHVDEEMNPQEDINDTLQILLVEDNAINIKWTLMLLGRYDYDIDYAENGEIAVDMAKQKHYDLILMDIDMPIMNGIEATQHIKAYELEKGLKHTPIVALTSHDQEGEKENILAQGLDEHLGKPLKLTELESLLYKYNAEKQSLKL